MTSNFMSAVWAAALTLTLAFPAGAQGGRSLFISPCGKPYRAELGAPYPVTVWFAEADTNHDGFLERGEFRADAAAFFAILDSNHDGVIDPTEVKVYEHTIVPEILRGGAEAMNEAKFLLIQYRGGGGGTNYSGDAKPSAPRQTLSEMGGAAPYGLLAEPEPVTAADTEFNGRITPAEFQAAADRRFEALDVNGQGRIALKDLPPTAVQQQGAPGA
jgi:hypothetical protein